MKLICSIFLFILVPSAYCQVNLNGVWQGVMVKNNRDLSTSSPFFLELQIDGNKITGLSREEIYNTDYFAIGKFYGTFQDSILNWKHVVYTKKYGSNRTVWCKLETTLHYNDSTGYLEGDYTATDCRQNSGKIILYQSSTKFSETEQKITTQASRDQMVKDLNKGRPAPVIRDIQRKNFVFQPIYFDYDKADIRPQYKGFLLEMVDIIDGHSDLRIRVTGNTDADGSEKYNEALSLRRAKAIIDFFVAQGLSKDRIEIEFNGEKKPVDRNDTEEGKQRNRRVEFEFI